MTTEKHSRIKDLFLEACDLERGQIETFLDNACADDPALRREVEELLAHDQEPADAKRGRTEVETVGSYRLLQKIGEGGMGEVWEAEQLGPIRRRVALKLVKWGMDTKEVLARFESERQALALMNHLNIAKAFEAGSTGEGRPFFAMEFVRGVPVTDYCDSQRLSTRDRLTLFMQVCDGVQHAHQKGVIHRDIKPSNILVTLEGNRPVPKIIDFGVAKAISQRLTERTLFTELGQWIGTPEYMSPEQAELTGLDVDTRTDVYSLGVVLYELLAGAQPFDSTELRTAGLDEMRRRIREEEPPKPSTRVSSLGDISAATAERRQTDTQGLARTLRGDLDWIVMKALEKDRTRRYGSPSDLSSDLRRYLCSEPVQASPPSAVYRARKFVSRHRTGVAASLAVIVLLVAGVIGTGIGLLKAQREAHAARKSADVLAGVLGTLDPSRPMGRALTMRQVLDQGTARVNRELEDMPQVQARLLATLGQAYLNLGHFEEALPLLERSLAIRSEIPGSDLPETASTLNTLGWVQYWLGDFQSSRASFQRSLEIRENSSSSSGPATSESLSNLAFLEWRLGYFVESEELFDRALEIIDSAGAFDDSKVADVLYHRSLLTNSLGRFDESLAVLNRALEIRKKALGPEHITVGWTYHSFGQAYLGLGDLETARSYNERSLDIFKEQLGPDHWSMAFPVTNLAVLDQHEGRSESARALYERGLAIRQETLPPNHPDQIYTLLPYGEFLLDENEIERAEELFEQALLITRTALAPDHPETASSRAHLGLVEWARSNYQEAYDIFDEALTIYRKRLPPEHRIFTAIFFYQATSAASLRQIDVALARLREIEEAGQLSLEILEHPAFEAIRGDPEFEAMLEEVRARLSISES